MKTEIDDFDKSSDNLFLKTDIGSLEKETAHGLDANFGYLPIAAEYLQ